MWNEALQKVRPSLAEVGVFGALMGLRSRQLGLRTRISQPRKRCGPMMPAELETVSVDVVWPLWPLWPLSHMILSAL